MTLPKGTRLGRYEVTGLVGAGGMGEVYRARDTRLARDVAVKILPNATAHSDGLARLEREARTVAALDHPNILSIFDVGTADDGRTFLVTEFLQGQTLRSRLQASTLAVSEAVRIVLLVSEALHAAHVKGVVHRDLKPENVFLTADGRVKVLDFGIARLRTPPAAAAQAGTAAGETLTQTVLTEEGHVPGTPGYMSPEQIRGGHVDARSDVFALGILLYETLTGRSPFRRDTPADTLAAVLSDEAPPLDLGSVLPSIARIVQECLRKRPEDRYQSAHDVALALEAAVSDREPQQAIVPPPPATRRPPVRRWPLLSGAGLAILAAAGALAWFLSPRTVALTDKDTVVVADFENRTGEKIFDDALRESLLVALRQSPFLEVLSEPRVAETLALMRRADARLTTPLAREVALRAGAKAVIGSSIARLGARYVVTLQGVAADTGKVFADGQGEADRAEDVIKALGEAVRRLRRPLGESLASIQKYDKPLEEATTGSLEALKAYSESCRLNNQGQRQEALTAARRAVQIDPGFAMAWRQLNVTASNLDLPTEAAEYAAKAFSLRDGVTERERYALADLYYFDVTGELDKLVANGQQWRQAYPRDSRASVALALALDNDCRKDDAIAVCRDALTRLDALALRTNLANMLWQTGRISEARAAVDEALRRYPEARSLHLRLLDSAFLDGDAARVDDIVRQAEGKPYEIDVLTRRADLAIAEGRLALARRLNERVAAKAEASGLREVADEARLVAATQTARECDGVQEMARVVHDSARLALADAGDGMALARCGLVEEARTVVGHLRTAKPLDTVTTKVQVPLIEASVAIQRGQFQQALERLADNPRFDGCYARLPYTRGIAYRGLKREHEALAEFEKVKPHNFRVFPLATLERARALAALGDRAKSRQAYEQVFALWKNADADYLPLKAARFEYSALR